MALANYTDLKTSVAGWLNRSDLTDAIPDFITLAEKQIIRRLRRTKVKTTLTLATEAVNLPAACGELVSIRLESGSPSRDRPFDIVTKEMLDEYRAGVADVAGRPVMACIIGTQIILAPTPSESYTAEIVYYRKLTPLTAIATTNDELTEAPDLYLYGALMEAAPYLREDERVPVWERKFEKALAELETTREREEFSASLRPVRLPRVFG